MMSTKSDRPGPPSLSLISLFLIFLRFGALAFGGPVAQIAMIRQKLVEEDGWIDRTRFNRLLAVLQILPGPEAHELCVHLGMVARGRIGGLLAGLGFMAPGLVLMLTAGLVYTHFVAGRSVWSAALLGVQISVMAIIVRAVARIGQHVIEDGWLAVIALASLVATLLNAPFWLVLASAGMLYALRGRPIFAIATMAIAVTLAMLLRTQGSFAVAGAGSPTMATTASVGALFIAGLKGGLLTFGGAYTAVPYVRADTVGRGWITDPTFLDGVALAGVLPAPLVIFATFVGYVTGGLTGALAITAGMFLPAFALSLILFERLEAIVENPALHRLLTGVAASVVGIIAATCIQLSLAMAQRVTYAHPAIAIFALASLLAWRARGAWVAPLIVLGGAAGGYLLMR